ncbi:hypothetical protein TsFJ059_008070 [Trichoderma semiorbis]|uniref:Uncharacterized protein n=1 Tax=Trichoderma semiorbis TaxID=1491008 RepID=A0A9P8KQM5_9HYPO|nr:hypothetical protein TsFJ059_008070 [Trichoderma semiorbis]
MSSTVSREFPDSTDDSVNQYQEDWMILSDCGLALEGVFAGIRAHLSMVQLPRVDVFSEEAAEVETRTQLHV